MAANNQLLIGRMPLVWQVVFLREPFVTNWWDHFSPEHLRHVMCYGYLSELDAYVVIDPKVSRTFVFVAAAEDCDEMFRMIDAKRTLQYRIVAKDLGGLDHRIGQWCSTQVARIVGLPGSAWRPIALLKTLEADNDAELVYRTADLCPRVARLQAKTLKRNGVA